MARKRFSEMNCSAAQALEQIGDWWTLLIVRECFYGTSTFSGFERNLGIAKNILTERLASLIEGGIILREQPKPNVDRYRYILTEKGRALLPVLVALMQWGDEWVFKGQQPLRILDATDRRPIAPVVVRAHDGRQLSIADLRFAPGDGASRETVERIEVRRR